MYEIGALWNSSLTSRMGGMWIEFLYGIGVLWNYSFTFEIVGSCKLDLCAGSC